MVLGAEGGARFCRLRESKKRDLDPSHKVKGKNCLGKDLVLGSGRIFLQVFQEMRFQARAKPAGILSELFSHSLLMSHPWVIPNAEHDT